MKIYYAHCVSLYGTPQEQRDLETLWGMGFNVINPNCEACRLGYEREGVGFFRRFADECDAMFFRALPDGRIPAGVAGEITFFQDKNKPIFELPSCM